MAPQICPGNPTCETTGQHNPVRTVPTTLHRLRPSPHRGDPENAKTVVDVLRMLMARGCKVDAVRSSPYGNEITHGPKKNCE
ncbi:uncharacterized protein J4E92_004842 [Alternaria infectoria]|uniref:uncharacterized protein n=1 Tax=Alternaria infectoria TaxID=45303 RepID=UPI002220D1CF|nr:uncharacterized protein J4E92_004842 [Alternaria infectoria]KAI4931008.1 hypothetical protein J4E92_004842 [Alternaria infectoria]